MHLGQNIGTEMPVSLPPDMEWECSGSALGRGLDSGQRGSGFEPHWCLTLARKIIPRVVLVQPRNTCPGV